MSESAPQNLKNHGRLDPTFSHRHFLHPPRQPCDRHRVCSAPLQLLFRMAGVLSILVFVPYFIIRLYPLKVQDRVIRLEERLRLQALAPSEWHTQIYRLSEDQLIGLRFAGDDEVVELAKQALEHNLKRKQIKERIKNWRADNWRV